MQLTKPELELVLRLGLAVNELLLFQRFVGAITNSRPQAYAAQDMWLAQLVTALMCSTEKVFEALEVFRKHFLSVPLGRELRPTLSQETQAAIEVLKALGGRDSLLANVRNLYSFHFHNDEDLSPYLDHLAGDAQLSLYYGLCDANTVHHFAVEPLVTSFMRTTGARTGEEAIVGNLSRWSQLLLSRWQASPCRANSMSSIRVAVDRTSGRDGRNAIVCRLL